MRFGRRFGDRKRAATVAGLLCVMGCSLSCAPKNAPEVDPTGTAPTETEELAPAPPQMSPAESAAAPAAAVSDSANAESLLAPDPVAAEALYEELALQAALYQEGVGLLREGEETAGEEQIREAMSAIAVGFESCGRLSGCDINRFFFTIERLLDEQNLALKVQASRIGELQTLADQDMEREAGTAPFMAEIPDVPVTPETAQQVSLLRGTDFRDVILLNEPVKAAMDDWLTWLRPLLLDSYENYHFLRTEIAPVYDEAGLPEALLFGMIATETGGKVHAHSRAGAAGLLQFIRSTGRRYGLYEQDGFDLRLDPLESTRANVAYLNELFEMFDGDLEKALAAYNGGENRIKRLNRQLGTPNFWDKRFYYSLPRETREYVPKILSAAWLFLHPEDYGLEFSQKENELIGVRMERETSLSELTVCLGQELNDRGWFRTLRNVNARLDPGEAIEEGAMVRMPKLLEQPYLERCRTESDLLARARELHKSNYRGDQDMIPYVVRRGDTLGKIAGRHRCVSVSELAAINRIRAPRYTISVGQTLRIPGC